MPIAVPAGIVALTLVLLQELTAAAVPLMVTLPVPCVAPKFVPVMATRPPIGTVIGARLSAWKMLILKLFVIVVFTES